MWFRGPTVGSDSARFPLHHHRSCLINGPSTPFLVPQLQNIQNGWRRSQHEEELASPAPEESGEGVARGKEGGEYPVATSGSPKLTMKKARREEEARPTAQREGGGKTAARTTTIARRANGQETDGETGMDVRYASHR